MRTEKDYWFSCGKGQTLNKFTIANMYNYMPRMGFQPVSKT